MDTWTAKDAYDGYAISKGIQKPETAGLTAEEINELQQWMKEEDDRHR